MRLVKFLDTRFQVTERLLNLLAPKHQPKITMLRKQKQLFEGKTEHIRNDSTE